MLDLAQSAEWLLRFEDLACCGYHILLAGNTADRHLVVDGADRQMKWLDTRDVLMAQCQAMGYELIVRYDVASGMSLLSPAMMELYEQAATGVRDQEGADADGTGAEERSVSPDAGRADRAVDDGDSQQGGSGTAAATAPPPLRRNRQVAGGRIPLQRKRDQAMPVIERLLSQDEILTAVVIEFADRLFPDQSGDQELADQVCLRRAMVQAALIRSGRPKVNWRNLLVMVSSGPTSSVPVYFYRENPHLTLLEIARPSRAERLRFFEDKLPLFCGGGSLEGEPARYVVAKLADLTDGLTFEELGRLLRLSVMRQISVAEDVKQVVNQLKYGERRDPWKEVDTETVAAAEQRIDQRVMGQPVAVRAISRALKHAKVGLNCDPTARGPKDVLMFAGPTGTGKTESAKAMAELLFGDSGAMTRLDMSEYQQEQAAERLAGAPPGYVGYEEGGQLTDAVRNKPYQLILLDEVEKAHKCIWDKLLGVLEDGRMTDGRGQTAFFENTIIVFTSNLGAGTLIDRFSDDIRRGTPPPYEEVRRHILSDIEAYFTRPPAQGISRPEVLGRISHDRIIVFDLLRPEVIRRIARKFFDALCLSARHQDLTLSLEGSIEDYIVKAMSEPQNMKMGGRQIKSLIRNRVENPLTEWLVRRARPTPMELTIGMAEDGRNLLVNGEEVSV